MSRAASATMHSSVKSGITQSATNTVCVAVLARAHTATHIQHSAKRTITKSALTVPNNAADVGKWFASRMLHKARPTEFAKLAGSAADARCSAKVARMNRWAWMKWRGVRLAIVTSVSSIKRDAPWTEWCTAPNTCDGRTAAVAWCVKSIAPNARMSRVQSWRLMK